MISLGWKMVSTEWLLDWVTAGIYWEQEKNRKISLILFSNWEFYYFLILVKKTSTHFKFHFKMATIPMDLNLNNWILKTDWNFKTLHLKFHNIVNWTLLASTNLFQTESIKSLNFCDLTLVKSFQLYKIYIFLNSISKYDLNDFSV